MLKKQKKIDALYYRYSLLFYSIFRIFYNINYPQTAKLNPVSDVLDEANCPIGVFL